ncbi:Non-repetitive/WGA-negative nucleoporin C-terminal-domain-containing protein [Podospora conica]|nr:Non-repetitive/WGA-negative nucleoporin C-terminal-domain-containing protein [Schizothecium conicum]
MFSPALQDTGPAKGTRSSRRRQRPLSNDSSMQQPKAKRQRVPLAETTFVNPEAAPEMYEVKSDKIDVLSLKRDGVEMVAAPRKELSVRSKKPKAERASKGDGSVVLTQNNAYTVSKLPALPDRLRADPQNRQHGAVYSSTGYALELTHTHAFVWPYTSVASSPETFTFTLPYPSKHASDPLPLGSLVSPSASSEDPGLVIVMPMSGRVAYWESISSAATLDFLRQQRSGVEDTIPGMFSGESVTQIVNAESAGFILVFSSGRLASLSVRDAHGRPGISVQFLRNGLSNGSSGFFGSLRHALSSSATRGNVAAARASQSSKVGERVVVAATTKGRLSCWRVHRGGRHDLLTDADVRDEIIRTVQQADPETASAPHDSMEVLDLAFVPRGLERKYVETSRLSQALSYEQDELQHLLLLVSFAGNRQTRYSIVEAVISSKDVEIGMVRPLTSYTTPVRSSAPTKPRLFLPRPGLVAFVVFDRAVVIASMAAPPDSPESQLQEDSHIIPPTFEDVLDFRDEGTAQIVGSSTEEAPGQLEELRVHRHRTKSPTAVLLLQGVGTIRVSVADIDRFASDKPPEVTAKSKLEQAVFFGIKNDNPLVFQGMRDLPFTPLEIANAAIELSHEIVSSKTPFIINLPASLENNMTTRGGYLDRLIGFLNDINADLDTRTRWVLLYNAEKMAVATWIWQKHEEFLAERDDDDKKTLVSETAVYINEQAKTEPNPAIGEVDPVRHWFINDVWRLDIFVAWAYQIIKYNWKEHLTDEEGINRLVYEAVTINNGALREAYEYRQNNWQLYNIDPNKVAVGTGIPEPWSSSHFITNNLKRLVEFVFQWLDAYYTPANPPVNARLLEEIRQMLPSLTNRYFTALGEYSAWASHSEDPHIQDLGKKYRQAYEVDTYAKILKLKDYALWDEAIGLAKEHEAFEALAEIFVQQILTLEGSAALLPAGGKKAEEELALADAKKREMGQLFEQYGAKFAYHAYEVLLGSSGIQAVLEFPYDKQAFATDFLRTKPELAKISWINDVEREDDIDRAAETLMELGLSKEQQVWSKKIELSLGKLALLVEEAEPSAGRGSERSGMTDSEAKNMANLEKIDHELSLIKIQDDLYNLILPSIEDALDSAAELEMVLKEHGGLVPKKHKVLLQILEDGFGRLLKHEALQPLVLIDLLTLAELPPSTTSQIRQQFYEALKVAKYGLKGQNRANAERLIWRRCLLRDDWKAVNETNYKNDADQLGVIGETAAYHTMFAIVDEQHTDKSFQPYVRPSDALGVFCTELDRRFEHMDEGARTRLLEAMRAEDAKLKTFVDKAQLDAWYRTTREVAERTVASAYRTATIEREVSIHIRNSENGNGGGNGSVVSFE